mmetsp:Transcript_26721/g.55467  ORF Transcript_26721/g.55467 Transcript_26721/m.55467 type:complete len:181 (-) Transcript_26721:59-601(-)
MGRSGAGATPFLARGAVRGLELLCQPRAEEASLLLSGMQLASDAADWLRELSNLSIDLSDRCGVTAADCLGCGCICSGSSDVPKQQIHSYKTSVRIGRETMSAIPAGRASPAAGDVPIGWIPIMGGHSLFPDKGNVDIAWANLKPLSVASIITKKYSFSVIEIMASASHKESNANPITAS